MSQEKPTSIERAIAKLKAKGWTGWQIIDQMSATSIEPKHKRSSKRNLGKGRTRYQ